MKRLVAVIMLAVMLLALTACGTYPEGTEMIPLTMNGEAVPAVFDYDSQTITVGGEWITITAVGSNGPIEEPVTDKDVDVYRYRYDDGNITITYPNGATWWESSTAGGWDDNYDPERYIDGDTLARQITKAYNTPSRDWDAVVGVGLACLVLIVVGIFMIKDPETIIHMKYSIRFHYVEPTDFAITEVRIAGVVAVVGAVILFLVAAFG